MDENKDGNISDTEINDAIVILEKAKKTKQLQAQKNAYSKFKEYDDQLPTLTSSSS